MSGDTLQALAAALGGKPSGDGFSCHCPAHADTNPSLSLSEANGKILWKCHRGCSQEAVLDALRQLGLDPGTGGNGKNGGIHHGAAHGPGRPPKAKPILPVPTEALETLRAAVRSEWAVERYGECVLGSRYTDANGEVMFCVARYEHQGKGKIIRPYYYGVDGKWHEGQAMEHRRPLLHLPEITGSTDPVLVVEGEKCAEVKVPGFVVTTWAGGAEALDRTDWASLAKRETVIWPDADPPGLKAALAIARRLPHASVLEIEGKAGGWDIADAQAEGMDLARFIADCPVLEMDSIKEKPTDPGDLQKDYGHAAVLAPHFIGRFRWASHRGSWMEWAKAVWQPVDEARVAKIASDSLREEYLSRISVAGNRSEIMAATAALRDACTYARVLAALAFLKGWPGVLTDVREWDANPWDLNAQNGILDLRTIELREHGVGDLVTRVASVDFDPTAAGPHWIAHIERCLPNASIRRHVQRSLGRALVGATLEETLDIWHGAGANLKSTTAKVVMRVLGDYAMKAAPNLLIQTKSEQHPTSVADLFGRRIVFSIEIDEGKWLAESLAKELTGGDRIKARFMRQDFFEFEPTHSLYMIVNHRPSIAGADQGIWRRVRLVPWTYSIPDSERRPQDEVVAELMAEGPAVLNWLLDGLRDWQADHGWTAGEVRAATNEYRAEQDALEDFISDVCLRSPSLTVPVGALYAVYLSWCELASRDPLGKRRFGDHLRAKGLIQDRTGHGRERCWIGLGLGPDAPPPKDHEQRARTNADSTSVSPPRDEKDSTNREATSASVRNGQPGLFGRGDNDGAPSPDPSLSNVSPFSEEKTPILPQEDADGTFVDP